MNEGKMTLNGNLFVADGKCYILAKAYALLKPCRVTPKAIRLAVADFNIGDRGKILKGEHNEIQRVLDGIGTMFPAISLYCRVLKRMLACVNDTIMVVKRGNRLTITNTTKQAKIDIDLVDTVDGLGKVPYESLFYENGVTPTKARIHITKVQQVKELTVLAKYLEIPKTKELFAYIIDKNISAFQIDIEGFEK